MKAQITIINITLSTDKVVESVDPMKPYIILYGRKHYLLPSEVKHMKDLGFTIYYNS